MGLAEIFANNGIIFWSGLPVVDYDLNDYGRIPRAYFSIYDLAAKGTAGVKTMAIKPKDGVREYHTIIFSPQKELVGRVDDPRFNFLGSVFGVLTQNSFERAVQVHLGALDRLTKWGY